MKSSGLIYALLAYLLWGVVPIFWKQLDHVPALEIVAHRVVWCAVWVVALIIVLRQWRAFTRIWRDKNLLLRLCLASLLISFNWGLYIWAVNDNQIVETSMGYFINPLMNVLFGVILFKEELRRNQWLAVAVMVLGVAYMTVVHGSVPWIALSLATSFACYGVIKKTVPIPATHGLAVETLLILLPALLYVLYLGKSGVGNFGVSSSTSIMLVLAGLLTLLPLLFFAAAAKSISMTALGMTQYLAPSIQLMIAVWVYREPFEQSQMITFGLIWLALFIYTLDQLAHRRKRKRSKLTAL